MYLVHFREVDPAVQAELDCLLAIPPRATDAPPSFRKRGSSSGRLHETVKPAKLSRQQTVDLSQHVMGAAGLEREGLGQHANSAAPAGMARTPRSQESHDARQESQHHPGPVAAKAKSPYFSIFDKN